jgi:ferredoxin-NADP reductase/DMSO/TMAO reductase YedYZ heme-binding membrane subunit
VTVSTPGVRRLMNGKSTGIEPIDVLLVAMFGVVGVVVTWWLGAKPTFGAGARLMDAGRLAGLLAGYIALLQILLRTRLPLIERTLGTNTIGAIHHTLGYCLLGLIVTHVVLITDGYAAAARVSLWGEIPTLIMGYPYVLWATVGLALLTVVAVTSASPIRRRMPYEAWSALHLAVYVALALAFLHQITDGEHLRHAPLIRYSWTAAFVTVAALMLFNRFIWPLWLSLRHELRVDSLRAEAPGIVSVWISGRRLDQLRIKPGQYFRWRFMCRRMWYTANPYSLSTEPGTNLLRFTAKTAGVHSKCLHRLRVGTRVIAEGPCGGLIAAERWDGPVLLVAAGIGITPLRAIFATASAAPGRLTLIYRAHRQRDLVFREELDAIAAARNARVIYLIGPRTDPNNQPTAMRLPALCPEVSDSHVYICGGRSFVDLVTRSAITLGVSAKHIRSEFFQL